MCGAPQSSYRCREAEAEEADWTGFNPGVAMEPPSGSVPAVSTINDLSRSAAREPDGNRSGKTSLRSFTSGAPSICSAANRPAATSSVTAERITIDTPAPACTAFFTASVLPKPDRIRSRSATSPNCSFKIRPVPLPVSPPSMISQGSSAGGMDWRLAHLCSGDTMTTSGSRNHVWAEKPPRSSHHSITATSASPRSSRSATSGFGPIHISTSIPMHRPNAAIGGCNR